MKTMENGQKLTFWEATSIIVGHGVGSGVLAVPFLASRNRFIDFVWIIAVAYCVNLLLHLMIAELSYNNDGAQFITCFEKELFVGKHKKFATWFAFALLGFSVLVNVSGFISGAAAVFTSWFGLPRVVGMLIYYVLAASVVYAGLRIVGICEKISVFSMVAVIGILFVATMLSEKSALPCDFIAGTNVMALYGMIAFSLSAVMSVPQVVKGLNGEKKGIRASIATGTAINTIIIIIITIITLIGAGKGISKNGALVDLSEHLGGWVSIVGYIFTLLALSTSFWANTLNLRDIIHEQVKWDVRLCWLLASLPCLILALLGIQSFVGFTRLAGIVQVLTGMGIIFAYNRSRKKAGESSICGRFGTLPFQILVIAGSLIATLGSVLSVK